MSATLPSLHAAGCPCGCAPRGVLACDGADPAASPYASGEAAQSEEDEIFAIAVRIAAPFLNDDERRALAGVFPGRLDAALAAPPSLVGDGYPAAPYAQVRAAGEPRSTHDSSGPGDTHDRSASFEALLRRAPQDEEFWSFQPVPPVGDSDAPPEVPKA